MAVCIASPHHNASDDGHGREDLGRVNRESCAVCLHWAPYVTTLDRGSILRLRSFRSNLGLEPLTRPV